MSEPDKYRRFALWVFQKLAEGESVEECDLLDQMEAFGIVEAKSHADADLPGTAVSLFWKEPAK